MSRARTLNLDPNTTSPPAAASATEPVTWADANATLGTSNSSNGQSNDEPWSSKGATEPTLARPTPSAPSRRSTDETPAGGTHGSQSETIAGGNDETLAGARPARKHAFPTQQDIHSPTASDSGTPRGWDRYELREVLGQGGCGVVTRAYDKQLRREVVVKRILPRMANHEELKQRFWHEAMITGGLEHPGIAPVHEAGEDPVTGEAFYAMKWLKGETLAEAIQRLHGIDDRRTWLVELRGLLERFIAVCQALAYAHAKGVIHRDLKPANIMLGDFGETVVLDWGIAKRIGDPSLPATTDTSRPENAPPNHDRATSQSMIDTESPAELTRQGSLLGTPSAMSPEQAQGQVDSLDARSDVFSLGSMLYELLTGSSPFRDEDVQRTLSRVINAEFDDCRVRDRRVPRPLAEVCRRALQRDPQDRYQSATQLADEIHRYLSGERVLAHRERWWEAADRWSRRNRKLTWTVVASLTLLSTMTSAALAIVHRAQRAESMAHAETSRQLVASREATDAWLIGISGDLRFYPGLDQLRADLLAKAHDHYARLTSRQATTFDQHLEQVRAQLRLGDLCQLRGESEPARLAFAAALDQLDQLESRPPADRETDVALQRVNALLGLAMTSGPRSDVSASLADDYLDDARRELSALRARAASAEIDNASVRLALLAARSLREQQQSREAATLLHEALPLAEHLYQQDDSSRQRHLLITLLSYLGATLADSAQFESAVAVYQQLLDTHTHALTRMERPDLLEGRAQASVLLGNLLLESNQSDLAAPRFLAAVDDYRRAWQLLYGDAYYSENIAIALANLSQATAASGDSEAAIAPLEEAIDWLRESIELQGADAQRVRRMTHCYLSLASLLATDDAERESLLSQSAVLLDYLEGQSPGDSQDASLRERWLRESER
ncbi:MAG: serine/threonine protein kinase [Planctomycetales bacterium]|nr:serine/threonine protein kinase [Planctomycetales bacterium]